MVVGQEILLNEVSSSGKSSISAELQDLFPRTLLTASIDTFVPVVPEQLIAVDPSPGHPAEQGMIIETRAATSISFTATARTTSK